MNPLLKTETVYTRIERVILRILPFVFTAITLASIVVRITMYARVRSLWIDEASLAENIVTRSFGNLISSPLAGGQTAPILYLYVVKIIGAIFGYTEGALRVYSFFALLGVLCLTYLLLKNVYQVKKILCAYALCLVATISIYARHSNELKPYMGDAFFVLLIFFLYHVYNNGQIKLPVLTILYTLILLFSSPALFFVAAVYIVEFIYALINKDRKRTLYTFISGITVLVCFICYYLVWLQPIAESDDMVNFWEESKFNLFAFSLSGIKTNVLLLYEMLGKRVCLYLPFAIPGILISLKKKDKLTFVFVSALFLLLVASQMGKWPLSNRLWLFMPALNVIYLAVCFDALLSRELAFFKTGSKYVVIFASFILLAANADFIKYTGDGMYLNGEEANPLIEYVQENIKDGEYLYSFSGVNGTLQYKNGYSATKIGNVQNDNIIYGGNPLDDIDAIIHAKKAYILLAHAVAGRTDLLIDALNAYGTLTPVLNAHDTPLYYWTGAE
ncbi:hypothetical protein FACS1894130_06580 [Spirochaetia bacterium]|nr:hypothetical protein FACS1894130_06580 [Spirochaetia bacterium]